MQVREPRSSEQDGRHTLLQFYINVGAREGVLALSSGYLSAQLEKLAEYIFNRLGEMWGETVG